MALDWRDILRAALEQGWRIEPTKKGFGLFPPDPDQPPYFVHKTPSDVRAIRNNLAELRRRGLVYPPPTKGE